MNKKVKQQWVKALRSGKYQQEKGRLQTDKGYCCLGVLCDVVYPLGWDYGSVSQSHYHSGCLYLPNEGLLQSVGLTPDDRSILTDANDEHNWTFEEIADYIEVML